ncbi:polyketide synthase peptide synthetase [Seiridium cupressi]
MASHESEPIAIVGSACRFPGGANSPSALWSVLEKPSDHGQDISKDRFNTAGFYHPDGSHHGTTNVRHAYLLQEDVRVFDAAFFNISPNEADSIDPQQRLLMETVYEALERGGHTIESLRGSDTAVYTGTMSVDYNDTGVRDLDTIPTYFATGTNRAIISNRISYVFDWRGPSMTIDTACSSSLIAVHEGVKSLRTGESRLAVACGTQVILNPETFIVESKLNMLSPTGRSRMWDADADGYARGEGVAAVMLKRLSDALADGDDIECLIRETGTNQDGHTSGITVPSTEAQAALIRQTYAKAGLDPLHNPADRPQYFEAHGTGTKAGDPKEAAAIHQSFGCHIGEDATPLYVGSVKTVIGHLEGAAGLAGLLKGSASIQNAFIPPNLLFNNLNPAIQPFYSGLHIPTQLTPWPALPEGVPRRVSVNSFGFGGSNAHAILEQYRGPSIDDSVNGHSAEITPFTPFVFSAANEVSLVAQLQAYSDYLKVADGVNPSDLAWTLQTRRSQFATRASFSAMTLDELASKMDAKLAATKEKSGSTIGIRASSKPGAETTRILGIFTGQGAQWATMGAALVSSSEYVRKRIEELEESLTTLPIADRPTWHLQDEILAGADTSRIAEAALSQPLCTAIQVVLVDLLQTAGVSFSAVVGHSSGEIGAAYAAGFLSARDAIRIAYYRGLYARLAGNSETGQKGAMLAVGTSLEDAQDLTKLRAFKGRLAIAAHNSSASITLSGDADAIIHAKKVFDEEKKFVRLLKVDTAYHSHHMLPCGDPYVDALRACGVRVNRDRSTTCAWYSSVTAGDKSVEPVDQLQDEYWRDNMTNAVLFADAVENAVAADDQISLAIEVGPHPALKGPATQKISDVRSTAIPYCGVLSRGHNDVEAFSDALGFIWTQFGSQSLDLPAYQKAVSSDSRQPKLVVGLPSYQWNHSRTHWSESRRSRKMRERLGPSHELLGILLPESNAHDLRWSNVLKESEISWLGCHQLQGQTVFPAAGYVAMALEASRSLAEDKSVELFELHELSIPRAVTFEEGDNSGVETLVTLTKVQNHQDGTSTADFSCYSIPVSSTGSKQELELMAGGTVKIIFGVPGTETLYSKPLEDYNMYCVDEDHFYSSLTKLGYGYSGPFRTLSSMKRRLGHVVGLIGSYAYGDDDHSEYLIHPSTLDVAFQASILAYSAPSDDRLWSLHVPTAIGTIRVNPEVCAKQSTSGYQVPVCSVLSNTSETFSGYIDLFSEDGENAMIQVEDLIIKPFAPATEADDRVLFTHTKFESAVPDGAAITQGLYPPLHEVDLGSICERLCYYYIRQWDAELTEEDWKNGQSHFAHLRDWVKYILSATRSKKHPTVEENWSKDTAEDAKALISMHSNAPDVKMIRAVGENIPASVRGETTILEHMLQDDLLDNHYKHCLGAEVANGFLADMMKQITHRYPHAKILEIGKQCSAVTAAIFTHNGLRLELIGLLEGAGTGGATKSVLESIGNTMSSYTYTDISVGFFGNAEKLFKSYSEKMTFKTLDVEKPPASQGFEPHSYDIVIASNVLHATPSLHTTLVNTRQLLKPGGYLLLLELTNSGPLRSSTIFGGLPGWWLGADDGRKLSPLLTPGGWHSALRKAGFGGVDAVTPEVNAVVWPASVMAAQAVDDRVQFLRRPLSSSSSSAIYIENLIILGTGTVETARVAEELTEHLERFCGQVTVLESLPTEAEALNLSPMSTFINLADVASPIFKVITEEKMEGIKTIAELARNILWITQGALADEPYHAASIAFSRVLRAETPHISLNVLDVSDIQHHNVAKSIAEHLLQLYALDEWESSQDDTYQLLWSKEPESFLERGKLKIPRLVENVDQNARLNSSRRVVARQVSTSKANILLSPPHANDQAALIELGPLATGKEAPSKVVSSGLMAVNIVPDIFLFLSISEATLTSGPQISLSTTNAYEPSPLTSVAVRAHSFGDQDTDRLLVLVASELLAESVIQSLSLDNSLLVHCSSKDRFLAGALSRHATSGSIHITFTCDEASGHDMEGISWTPLSARAPQHVIRRELQRAAPSHFLDLTTACFPCNPTDLSIRVSRALPSSCKKIDPSALFQHQSLLPSKYDQAALRDRLEIAVASVTGPTTVTEDFKDLVVQLGQVRDSPKLYYTNVVHWPLNDLVKAEIRALDDRQFFSKDRTYLLVGLTGKLGQSLCEWMVLNGAGCVCLTSRRPDIDERWMKSFQGTGAMVKVFAMDVTNKHSVDSVVKEIRDTCPQIAGVAHGAMVLHDSLFSRMSASKMQEILGPKVDGANYLDDAFKHDDLDFFVMFSSVSNVIGNAGQSLYAAGNGYLNGLARQRRRRGLAASTFDIGRVVGIGYVETAAQVVRDQLIGLGLPAISELDMRKLFAETIRAGFPDSKDKIALPDAIVSTGIRYFREDEDIKGPWFTNPLFSHCVIEQKSIELNSGDQAKTAALPVAQQLVKATTKTQALDILLSCFSAKLRLILQLADQEVDYQAPLNELGIDSLVAVEVRSWFLKELRVDIPVLKVIGGASPAELCQRALEKLPEDLLVSVGKQGAEPSPSIPKRSVGQLPTQPNTQQPFSGPLGKSATDSVSEDNTTIENTPLLTPAPQDSSATQSSTGSVTADDGTADLKKQSKVPQSYFTAKAGSEAVPTSTNERQPKRFIKSVPISLSQSRFWFLQHLLEDQRTHNVAYYYHITGNLHISNLERAVRVVAARHESLRTCFVADQIDAAQANQKVLPSSALRLECKRINSVEEVSLEYEKLRMYDFDMASGELLRIVLLTLSPSSHCLLMYHHHIIMDGISLQVFLSDLEKAYSGKPLGPPPRQYPEFSVAQRLAYEKGEMGDELKYWQRVFPAGEQPPVLPLLPMARTSSRIPMKKFDTHQVEYKLDSSLAMRVRSVSKTHRSTPFHFYLAAFKAMLFAFTDAQDLTIGVADAARNDGDIMGSIGFFLNLLTLRFRRQQNQAFADAIIEARDTAYAALENSRVPFDVLLAELNVARSSSHSPFFQAFIDYRQGAQAKHPFGNCQFEIGEINTGKTAYDITLDVTDSLTDVLIMFRAQKSLYDLSATKLLSETFVHFLEVLTEDTSIPLQEIPLFSERQRTEATKIGRGPQFVSDWPATLPHRIDQVAQQNSDEVALMDGNGKVLTYSEMSQRIEGIAEALHHAGAGVGSRVLVFQDATSDWPCSMFAIMRLGAIYVPLDLRNPISRLAAVAKDCEPKAIIVDATTLLEVPQLGVGDAAIIDVSSLNSAVSTCITNSARPELPAAILYTSGSTGTPKGIVVTHAGLRNEIEGYTKKWNLGAERTLQQSAFTFNHSSDQIYTALTNGGMVYIVPWSKRGNPIEITEIIQQHGITYTKATPSEYLLWMQYGGDKLKQASQWRFAFGGGENLTTIVTHEFADLGLPQLRVYNSYGPTEISISSTKTEVSYRDKEALKSIGRIPCGYSLPNYNTYVVDAELKPLPAGMPGELCIGGAGVSLGYFKNPELTRQHFVADPFASPDDIARGWTTMYRTGDIGHLTEDGAMVFHSRMAGDTQVKIRGLRIELSDIESNIITAAAGVLNEALVTLRDGDPEFLVAHVVFAPQHNIGDKEEFLERILSNLPVPQYMVPVAAISLDKLPLTNHSKVDRKAVKELPLPRRTRNGSEDEEELTETMVQLKSIWREVLGKGIETLGFDITPATSFFLVGGNSLLVIRLQAHIRRTLNVAIPLVELLGANTLGQMARKVEESSAVTLTDWEQETTPPRMPSFLSDLSATIGSTGQEKFKTVLITGSTGYLAKYLLPQLIASSEVGTIHCVAVREKEGRLPRDSDSSSKVVKYRGDLSQPLLGLSEADFHNLASQVDVIIHLGGTRSFWDNYNALRLSNVLPTKELVKLAAPRRVPIHYISTVGVLPRGVTLNATSAAAHLPPVDGSNGYVATRWTSERILERAGEALGIPSFIYRFLPAAQQHPSPATVLDKFVHFVDVTGLTPDTAGWGGRLDMIPADQVAEWLRGFVLPEDKTGGATRHAATQFFHYESPVTMTMAELDTYIREKRGNRELEQIPIIKFVGRIKALGFDYFLASHEAIVGGGAGENEGARLESRR